MSSEHPTTLVTLKDYVDTRLTAMDRATEQSCRAMDARLNSMNEFREALRDQSGRMATRQELEDKLMAVERDLRILREFQAELRGKASQQSVMVAYVLAMINLLMALYTLFVR